MGQMQNQLGIIVILAVVGVFAAGGFPMQNNSEAEAFDYNSATPQERKAYLVSTARQLTTQFSPSYIAKNGAYKVGGRSITLSYNMRMSKIDCDTDYSCKVLQCDRYLKSPISKNNISLRIRYLNAKGQQIGTQLLKNSSCRSVMNKANIEYPGA